MFNYIRGKLIQKTKNAVIIENHGIGYFLTVPATTLAQLINLGEEVKLFTYLAVREDDLSLYGFSSAEDLAIFELLLSVSGVGPKAALAVLSTLSTADFYLAVMHENVRTLTRVPGVGPKSAKRLIMELKDKVAAIGGEIPVAHVASDLQNPDAYNDAMEALLALGYNGTEAQTALQAARKDGNNDTGQALLRRALAQLGMR
ncbi:MAG: Holliday junction branch migration protein RuvA [Clostridiales bacterium]|jgi:Holliday junction DNA helicase RuvA|nr:Holliday junction branch migration protein RuvA [Clostridiales bacterium]